MEPLDFLVLILCHKTGDKEKSVDDQIALIS